VLAGLGEAEAHAERKTFTCRVCNQSYVFDDHHACLDRLSPRGREADYFPTVWRRAPNKMMGGF
jgi:hypothetical protein